MTEDLGNLITEQQNQELAELDRLSTVEIARIMNAGDAGVPRAVSRKIPAIAAAIDAIAARMSSGGRLIYAGTGTAGRLGVLDAAECGPTFNAPPDQVQGVIAGGKDALINSSESAEDDPEAGARDIEKLGITDSDVVVGISASGRTPYTLGAVERAREIGALTVGISCNPGSKLSAVVDHPIEVITGPELISGSTRLKAGTAQKLVLNMISTITMIRLGKTYGNLMVDLRATNTKLRARARRIVELATGASGPELDHALESCGGEVKTAIVMLLAGTDVTDARSRLERSGGRVREALETNS